jgi:phosphinothricin acetyltransferase
MATRIGESAEARLPFLVAVVDDVTLGFASASRWKGRCAYRYSAETTVYVTQSHWQRGVGKALYSTMLGLLQRSGCHAAIGGIALPNESSIRLHERLGFTQVAQFREVGFKFNRWIDVGYWQRLFA